MARKEKVSGDEVKLQSKAERESTPWHNFFEGIFKIPLIPLKLEIETNYPVGKGPPKLDVLIIRRTGNSFTKEQLVYLSDGIRQNKCKYIILEFKKTQSVSLKSIWQSMGYFGQYLDLKGLYEKDTHIFLISSKTPRKKTLQKLDFLLSETPGVYTSVNKLTPNLTLIVANELSNKPHNLWIKLFASKQKQKLAALKTLLNIDVGSLSRDLKLLIVKLIQYWHKTGEYTMKTIKKDLTPESYLELDSDLLNFLSTHFSVYKLFDNLKPEDRIKGLKPEDRLKGLKPEERIKGLKPEKLFECFDTKTIEAYLKTKKFK